MPSREQARVAWCVPTTAQRTPLGGPLMDTLVDTLVQPPDSGDSEGGRAALPCAGVLAGWLGSRPSVPPRQHAAAVAACCLLTRSFHCAGHMMLRHEMQASTCSRGGTRSTSTQSRCTTAHCTRCIQPFLVQRKQQSGWCQPGTALWRAKFTPVPPVAGEHNAAVFQRDRRIAQVPLCQRGGAH